MKNHDIGKYIGSFLDKYETLNEVSEVKNIILLLIFYQNGLQQKELPIEKLNSLLEIDKEIPEQFHTFVAQLAILKSGCDSRAKEYILENVDKISKEYIRFFLTI